MFSDVTKTKRLRTMRSTFFPLPLIVFFALFFLLPGAVSATESSEVRALFFTSPTCPFCTLVSERDLGPLEAHHGAAFQLLRIDTTTSEGRTLLHTTWEHYQVPRERRGVPTILIDQTLLVGAQEIPARLPDLVETHLAEGGLDWPELPGLDAALESGLFTLESPAAIETESLSWQERFQSDLPGNYLSLSLLVLMLLLLLITLRPARWQRELSPKIPFALKIAVATAGLVVALYLTYGETSSEELFCGPVGQCNVVQQSNLAMLFGFLPLGLVGALAYLSILALYLSQRFSTGPYQDYIPLLLFALTTAGFLFSIFLTFWQPFLIGATCIWCLASAITMSFCFLFNYGAGRTWIEAHRS